MSLDLKIAGGTVVDGTGSPRYSADIGIRDGRVVEIGSIATPAARTLDANGALVTPGFIDMHTHYDAQVFWDSELITSSRNGVTTAVMGNCGVGCAPYVPAMKEPVKGLMGGVEDIPGSALDAALPWNWDSFGSYLDRVGERPHAINVACHVGHAAIRMVVMGERAYDRSAPTPDDISRMQALLTESLEAGASAFSTDRFSVHRMADGSHVPDYDTSVEEMRALAQTLAKFPGRPLQYATDYACLGTDEETAKEFAVLGEVAALGMPVFVPLGDLPFTGGWRRITSEVAKLNSKGANILCETAIRAIGAMLGLDALLHPFSRHPSYMKIAHLPFEKRLEIMRDPSFRARILSEEPQLDPDDVRTRMRFDKLRDDADKTFIMDSNADYEPVAANSIKARAEREGKTLSEVYYDALVAGDGHSYLYVPLANFGPGNLDDVHEMLSRPETIVSFGDAGAHLASICDGAYASWGLSHWCRDRTVGIPLEALVRKMSSAQADLFNFKGRGRIEIGSVADLNVIDHAALKMEAPKMLYDIPGGSSRLIQCATGFIATFVGGTAIVEHDVLTGAMPGQVLRC